MNLLLTMMRLGIIVKAGMILYNDALVVNCGGMIIPEGSL